MPLNLIEDTSAVKTILLSKPFFLSVVAPLSPFVCFSKFQFHLHGG